MNKSCTQLLDIVVVLSTDLKWITKMETKMKFFCEVSVFFLTILAVFSLLFLADVSVNQICEVT